ncbi:hypothetical protein EVAR_101923_1 [Eumeta japonica]|uniref:Uncharacterized protein n=1 Tax=Eumeta variegata TaxID=151549 RepID=A0A4C1TSD1_EUMVA|nr:hypothetical protein EVAR_101923_1 [Eumeta japonica]
MRTVVGAACAAGRVCTRAREHRTRPAAGSSNSIRQPLGKILPNLATLDLNMDPSPGSSTHGISSDNLDLMPAQLAPLKFASGPCAGHPLEDFSRIGSVKPDVVLLEDLYFNYRNAIRRVPGDIGDMTNMLLGKRYSIPFQNFTWPTLSSIRYPIPKYMAGNALGTPLAFPRGHQINLSSFISTDPDVVPLLDSNPDSASDSDSGSDIDSCGSVQNIHHSPAAPSAWTYNKLCHRFYNAKC